MSDSISTVLGLPQEVTSFTDGKPRKAYPIKMKDFQDFIKAFASLNKRLWACYLMDETGENVRTIISMTFTDNTIDDILENSTAKTFDDMFEIIKSINGINFEELSKNVMEV